MFTAILLSPTPESGSLVVWCFGCLVWWFNRVSRFRVEVPDQVRDDGNSACRWRSVAYRDPGSRGARPERRGFFPLRDGAQPAKPSTRYGAEDENFDSIPQPPAPSQGFATIATPERTFGA